MNTDVSNLDFGAKQGDNTTNRQSKCEHDKEKVTGDSSHDDHDHVGNKSMFMLFLPASISLILLLTGIYFDQYAPQEWFQGRFRFIWYLIGYLPVGLPVLLEALRGIRKGDVFSEFFLMCIATLGAFAIKEYPEGVAVMLFYTIGEIFQTLAVNRAKANISSLLDQRPNEVSLLEGNIVKTVQARDVKIGEIIQLRPGEKLGLDGILISERASFNTAALTGESKPDTIIKDGVVLAGMINLQNVAIVKVTTAYNDSKLAKIIKLIEDASKQKAPTELFIRKFAKVYTPIVVILALLICFVPYLITSNYVFTEWLYRALVFLVISCPCALVISIPLGYFGGIGAASKHGILFKGSSYLDSLATIQNVVVDKTGTLTKGIFKVQEVVLESAFERDYVLNAVNALESQSTHPVATAIKEFVGEINPQILLKDVEEIAGFGLIAFIDGKKLVVGNFKLLDKLGISYSVDANSIVYTVIAIALDGEFVGYITISDEIKEDAKRAVDEITKLGINITMLSGDKDNVVQNVATKLGITNAYGNLLPEGKVEKIKSFLNNDQTVAFVGDGVNDAPVVALSTVGIAMGGLGSDATIETADVVIQDDQPSKIATAIKIGKITKKIVYQNIFLAFSVKVVVLILGAGGLATMWEAVFADVGVAFLAILNAIRVQNMKI